MKAGIEIETEPAHLVTQKPELIKNGQATPCGSNEPAQINSRDSPWRTTPKRQVKNALSFILSFEYLHKNTLVPHTQR